MTHYRVAVINKDENIDLYEFLARYDENRDVEPYIDITREEALAKARRDVANGKQKVEEGNAEKFYMKLASHFDDPDEELLSWYAEKWCDQERDEQGNFLTTYNPDSKYDYFMPIDEMTFDEWLATGSDKTEEELRESWRKLSSEGDGFWRPEYYQESYGDEETFVKSCKLPMAWSIVTPDGEWHEPGQMGWFACDDSTAESRREWVNTFDEKFVIPYKDTGAKIIILDCHI